jgi:hypothetical protein
MLRASDSRNTSSSDISSMNQASSTTESKWVDGAELGVGFTLADWV